MNLFTNLREKCVLLYLQSKSISQDTCMLYLKDRSILIIILAFTIGIALFELGVIILINRFHLNESEAYSLCKKTFKEQHYDTVVKCLKGFVKKFPKSKRVVDVMYSLAISHQKQKNFSAESKVWQQIIQHNNPIDPEKIQEAYYNLGICQENLDNIEFAIKSYEAASKGSNESIASKALFSVGRLSEQQNLDSKAVLVYHLIMTKFPKEESAQEAANKLGELNLKHLPSENQTTYKVKPGDNLISIAKRFKTTVLLIMEANGLDNTSIKIGMDLKVPQMWFGLDIGIEDKLASLLCEGYIVKQYRIATGAPDKPTPTGNFSIINKSKNPTWHSPDGPIPTGDPRNQLGTRWMGILNEKSPKLELGIHGTNNPETIGQNVSDGCIRLRNEDIEEIFDLISIGDTVHIMEHLESRPWYSWVDEVKNEDDKITGENR